MQVALRKGMTQDEFFAWAEGQDGRYEFDGFQPVGMVGGTMNHGILADNIRAELRQRLRGGPCRSVSPDGGGIETIGKRVRYPEATVTCSPFVGTDRIIPNPVIVFEVVSESTRRIDQVFKLREYHSVPSIKRYIIVEQAGIALTVHARQNDEPWVTTVLGEGDVLSLPEVGLEIPVAAIYDDVVFDGQDKVTAC
jgi:Uma2 family endonuclease